MKIDVVQLENIRSHVKSTVPFTSGFNCVVGGVGCGKSSIMYAVDFALFGESVTRSFEYLLRDGASHGKVFVQFSQNGKTYKITRGLFRERMNDRNLLARRQRRVVKLHGVKHKGVCGGFNKERMIQVGAGHV